ncbi:MAG: hypothetical protein ABEJ81_01775 [Haloferacaceae archaeon]
MTDSRVPEVITRNGNRELEPSEIHDVLRNDRRRLVLERLRDEESETVRDLSEHIASVEADERPAPRNVRQSVYVSLHQTHLPKLDDLGIVTYDADEKNVRLAEGADQVTVYMEVVPKYGLSWAEYYLGLGILGALLLLGHVVGVPGIVALDPSVLAAGLVVVLIGSAAYHVSTQESTPLDRLRR